jgi:hypothetical protein
MCSLKHRPTLQTTCMWYLRYCMCKNSIPQWWCFSNTSYLMSRDSSVDIVTRLRAGRLNNRSSISGRCKAFFSIPKCPDRLWSPTNNLINVYRGPFPEADNLHLVSRLRMHGGIPPLSYMLRGVNRELYQIRIYKLAWHRHKWKINLYTETNKERLYVGWASIWLSIATCKFSSHLFQGNTGNTKTHSNTVTKHLIV